MFFHLFLVTMDDVRFAPYPRCVRANAGCKHFDVHGGPENIPLSRFILDAKVIQITISRSMHSISYPIVLLCCACIALHSCIYPSIMMQHNHGHSIKQLYVLLLQCIVYPSNCLLNVILRLHFLRFNSKTSSFSNTNCTVDPEYLIFKISYVGLQ